MVVHQAAGWQAAALVPATFSLLPLPFILSWRERETTGDLPTPWVTLRSAVAFFSRSAVRWWCLLLIPAYTAGFTVAYHLVRPILVAAAWDERRMGLVVVIGGSGVGIASAWPPGSWSLSSADVKHSAGSAHSRRSPRSACVLPSPSAPPPRGWS